MRRELLVLCVLISVIAVLAVVRAEVEVDLNLHDQEVALLREKTLEQEETNTILRDRIYYFKSLGAVASEAATMGFEEGVVRFKPRPRLYGLQP